MNNFVAIIGICLISAVFVEAGVKHALKKKYEECGKELGYSKDDLAEMKKNKDPKEGCVMACVLKKEEIMADGDINEETAFKKIKSMKSSRCSESQIKTLVEKCLETAKKETEECAKAGLFGTCVMEEDKRGKGKDQKSSE